MRGPPPPPRGGRQSLSLRLDIWTHVRDVPSLMPGNESVGKADLCFVVTLEPGRYFAVPDTALVHDRPHVADVRLAMAGFSGTDLAITLVLAVAFCEDLLCVLAKLLGIPCSFICSDVSFRR